MQHWFFRPIFFYPIVILAAALVIAISLGPHLWPRAPGPVAGELEGGSIVIEGAAFNSPDKSPEQEMTVDRNFWGRARSLLIAQLPNQPPPTPAEQGVRILLTPERIALIEDRPVTVEVSYAPLPVNPASGLAVSVQGIGPAEWVSQPTPAEPGALRYELPAQFAVSGIGLRALSELNDQAYGLQITRIRITPH